MKQKLLALLLCCLVSGCASWNSENKADNTTTNIPTVHAPKKTMLEPFSAIEATGAFDLVIQGTPSSHSRVVIEHESSFQSPLGVSVENDILHLVALQNPFHPLSSENNRPTVTVFLSTLNDLKYSGSGRVLGNHLDSASLDISVQGAEEVSLTGHLLHLQHLQLSEVGSVLIQQIQTPSLDIDTQQTGVVTLRGVMGLKTFSFSGNGKLSLYWLKSCNLEVTGRDTAQAFIAGIADTVNISLEGGARLNAKYLRADRVYATTRQHTSADVWARSTLNAKAYDQSSIYYYNPAKYITPFMENEGSVLRMIGLDLRACTPPESLYHRCPTVSCTVNYFK